MPLYEYQCDACAHRFEVIQKYSDAPIGVCPKCGGGVSKLLSSPAIQFKGSGFYLTDYGRAGKTESSNVSGGKNESGASPSESKPDSKPESKPDSKTESKSDAKSAPAPSASPTKSD
jgi:putative FmdB family regulatory protein